MSATLLIGLVIARVQQVLKDRLTTELGLLDTAAADGFTSAPIPVANYHDWDRKDIPQTPACTAQPVDSIPIEVRPDRFGRRVHAVHRLALKFHASVANVDGGTPRNLQRLLERYVAASVSVVTIMYPMLETVADPVEWGTPNARTLAEWKERATYGPEPEQADGAVVLTATLPIEVTRVEVRS